MIIEPTARAWFAPKRYGYGAGLPIAWQGWALLLAFIGVLVGAAIAFLPTQWVAFVAATGAASVVLTLVAARHTRGGWRWRWGNA
ncbi:MAG: hypothetical protein V4659_06690 [Pseudomonadota bacterium]